MGNFQTQLAQDLAWKRYKKDHPVKAFLFNVAVILLLCFMLTWPVLTICFTIYECNSVCSANGDESIYRITQGCFCVTDDGIYNPKDSR